MGADLSKPQPIESVEYPKLMAKLPKLNGKNIAITGTTSGTGLVAAKSCLELGATVYILNRKSSRSENALKQLKEVSSNVFAIECDLMSMKSVKKAGNDLHKQLNGSGLDVLCCNAGVMALPDEATEDGYDVQSQVNHLSQMLLFSLVISDLNDAIKQRGDARVITHSSGARKSPLTAIDAKYFEKNGGNLGGNGSSMMGGGARWERYHQTKLSNAVIVLALRDLAKEQGSKIRFLTAHPGVARTQLQVTTHSTGGMGTAGISAFFERLMMKAAQSPEDGTCGILRCIADDDVETGFMYGPTGPLGLYGPAGKIKIESEMLAGKIESRKVLIDVTLKAIGIKEFNLI